MRTGRAVQSMRSVTYLQPGERRGCVGCHETPGSVPPNHSLLACDGHLRGSSRGPMGRAHELSAARAGGARSALRALPRRRRTAGTVAPVLTGEVGRRVHAFVHRVSSRLSAGTNGAVRASAQIVTRPGHGGADESPLMGILSDEHHRRKLEMPDTDLRRLSLWLDANAPFYGTYREETRSRQLAGETVDPPLLQ